MGIYVQAQKIAGGDRSAAIVRGYGREADSLTSLFTRRSSHGYLH